MKIDIKLIIILLLLCLSVFFFFKWLNVNDDVLASENKKLLKEIKIIEKQRDSLSILRLALEKEFKLLESKITERDARITKLLKELTKSEEKLEKAKSDLAEQKSKLDEINKKIEEIKKLPIKREGKDLLNSMKKKLENK